MIERLIRRTDKYLRDPDTQLANTLHHIAPETGSAYRTSKKKAIIDRSIAVALSIPVIPVMGALAVARKLEDRGPIFYKSERIGKGGVIFNMTKIRSLIEDADQDDRGNLINTATPGIPDDQRATPLGQWMRRYRLDEIPQVLQSAFGRHMSFFGMRPDTELTWETIKEHLPKGADASYSKYTMAKPGSLSPQGVFHRHGSLAERERNNAFYAEHASLGLDLYMAFRAVTRKWLRS